MKALELADMIERYNAGVMSQAICEDYLKAADELRRLAAVEAEFVRLNARGLPDEPDWRHPKIQGLIGSVARLRITVDLIRQIIEDPNQEFTASDMEYWEPIHDRLKEALSTKPAQPLTDEQCDAIYMALDDWAREFDECEFGLPRVCDEERREVIRHAMRSVGQ